MTTRQQLFAWTAVSSLVLATAWGAGSVSALVEVTRFTGPISSQPLARQPVNLTQLAGFITAGLAVQ